MRAIEQWEAIKLMATERGVDIDDTYFHNIRIGGKRYQGYVNATCALLSAFDKIGTYVPEAIRQRPDDMR